MTTLPDRHPDSADNDMLLEVRDLKKHFPLKGGFWQKVVGHVKAVDGISFTIRKGETVGLVGESGCGKTTTGRLVVRAMRPTAGQILFHGPGQTVDLARADKATLKNLRKHIQMIFQDPYSSLNPRMTVLDIVGEPLTVNGVRNRKELEDRAKQLLQIRRAQVRVLETLPACFQRRATPENRHRPSPCPESESDHRGRAGLSA